MTLPRDFHWHKRIRLSEYELNEDGNQITLAVIQNSPNHVVGALGFELDDRQGDCSNSGCRSGSKKCDAH